MTDLFIRQQLTRRHYLVSALLVGSLAVLLMCSALAVPASAQEAAPPFHLKPAVSVEAEDFVVKNGWKVIKNGHGNYMVDIIGFQHISGERLLCTDEKNTPASAYRDIKVPVGGSYRLWVRYEYPPFSDARFQVQVMQGGKVIAQKIMGAKANPRLAFGDKEFKAQFDPPTGSEGLAEEVLDVSGLKAGKARLYLKNADQPQVPGVSAGRHIDLLYLSSDLNDAWRDYYFDKNDAGKVFNAATGQCSEGQLLPNRLYPILDAFRDSSAPRYEVRFVNTSATPATFFINYTYNRLPWSYNAEGTVAAGVAPRSGTQWIPLTKQDTAHFSIADFEADAGKSFTVAIRPVGGSVVKTLTALHGKVRAYLPTYPGKGEVPITPEEEIDAVLKLIADSPAVGKTPTLPFCYGAFLNMTEDSAYSRKSAKLFAALGLRAIGPDSDAMTLNNRKAVGIELNKSITAVDYRNPLTQEKIDYWKQTLTDQGLLPYFKWYDYGDEISFTEWLSSMSARLATTPAYQDMTPDQIYRILWQKWLTENRPGYDPAAYWMKGWGAVDPSQLRPDSTAAAAKENPRLYVDSLIFYEETSIKDVAQGLKLVKKNFGDDVYGGANYSAHPFYYPSIAMYVKWFREGAADMGRHSEYFWQVSQPGPMINGYIAEHFHAGMRFNPRAINRQYVQPHSPGNTQASFLRTAFTQLAHGSKMLDFFGIGMNETFTENYIDHRDHQRYKDIHDIAYSIGLVEDMLPQSTVVPSRVAILLSDSTERWDMAGIALDQANLDIFGKDFRKARLTYHEDRVGLWYALTFLGAAPDLLIEEDINLKLLPTYDVLYMVGDHLPPSLKPALEQWVRNGGVLMADAGAGRFDSYRNPNPNLQGLLGIASRSIAERTTFTRPRQELAFLKPLSTIGVGGVAVPQIATYERIVPVADAKTVASFKDGKPAIIERALGTGKIYYCAALPGLAYLWSGLQPATVPDRGVNTHTVPAGFNKGAAAIITMPLSAAKISPIVVTDGKLIDTRLIQAPNGYILPLANYNRKVGQQVTVRVKLTGRVTKVTSAYRGVLPFAIKGGRLVVTIPSLGYGDLLRIDTAATR